MPSAVAPKVDEPTFNVVVPEASAETLATARVWPDNRVMLAGETDATVGLAMASDRLCATLSGFDSVIVTSCVCPALSVSGDGARFNAGTCGSIISEKIALPVDVEMVNTLAPSAAATDALKVKLALVAAEVRALMSSSEPEVATRAPASRLPLTVMRSDWPRRTDAGITVLTVGGPTSLDRRTSRMLPTAS
jgi:hypothetical protein